MAPQITSAIVLSPTSSLNCIVNIPKPPSSVHTRPSKSSIIHLTNNLLLPPLSSYLPMSPSEIDHQYIPTDPLYLPHYRTTLSFGHFKDGSRTMIHRNHSTRPTSHYIKIPHYRITHNPSHQTTSLIRRRVMSWRDAWGLEEWHGCCGRKLFYCSKLALLNDDDDDKEETLGEYVQSTKQLKKIRSWVEMPKRKDSMDITTETFSPWFWWIILWLISFVTQQTFLRDSLI